MHGYFGNTALFIQKPRGCKRVLSKPLFNFHIQIVDSKRLISVLVGALHLARACLRA